MGLSGGPRALSGAVPGGLLGPPRRIPEPGEGPGATRSPQGSSRWAPVDPQRPPGMRPLPPGKCYENIVFSTVLEPSHVPSRLPCFCQVSYGPGAPVCLPPQAQFPLSRGEGGFLGAPRGSMGSKGLGSCEPREALLRARALRRLQNSGKTAIVLLICCLARNTFC